MENKDKQFSAQLKSEIIKLMDGMIAFPKAYPKFNFPKTSENFSLTRELLEKGEFNLAVCGKVKNGKSSLINALIGKELLPVCTDVATSRVFKISHSKEEKFYVVYGNGNRKEISKEELATYGSQAVINKEGEAEIENTISYIQVFTPMDFLPEGVSLIDTPGIGSTYPHHTAITKQYIKQADAVMFVMNPTPLEDIEVDFLKEIVSVTPGILFVTTKIDQNGNESVEKSLNRNHQIIEKAVGNDLPFGISMLKMSSKLLLEAAIGNDEITSEFNYEISGYDDVKSAMNNMVFTILGYYRSGLAYNVCVEYYREVLNALKLRHETAVKAATEYDTLLKSYEKALANFNENMGDSKRKELFTKVEKAILQAKDNYEELVSIYDFKAGCNCALENYRAAGDDLAAFFSYKAIQLGVDVEFLMNDLNYKLKKKEKSVKDDQCERLYIDFLKCVQMNGDISHEQFLNMLVDLCANGQKYALQYCEDRGIDWRGLYYTK